MRLHPILLEFFAWWLFTLGLWCAFIGTITSAELLAGTAAGLIAALTAVQLHALGWATFRPSLGWVTWLPLVVITAVVETALLARELGRYVFLHRRDAGEFRTVTFRPAGQDNRARAHRALGIVAVSATPGSIVFETYPERGEARVHVFASGGPDILAHVGREDA